MNVLASAGTILIVDDTPSNIFMLLEALEEQHKVIVAKSGQEALEQAKAHMPDLILLDAMMPEMDGFEVCRRLKDNEQLKDIPVVFVTALDDNLDEEKGLQLGAIDYIRKPFHLPVAKARIRNHLRLKRKSDMLDELVRIDGLTDIYNRRGFDEALEREWRRCMRQNVPLSLLMLDIDNFKHFNDRYGHANGDACLIKVAQTVNITARRSGDFIARYGGEEFAALLPETPLDSAKLIGEKIRQAVAGLGIVHEYSGGCGHVTVSLGVCSMVPQGEDFLELVRCADSALYKAKNEGRNCVLTHESLALNE